MSSITLTRHAPQERSSVSRQAQVRLFLIALFCNDVLMLSLSFLIANIIRFQSGLSLFEDVPTSADNHILIAAVLVPIWLGVFAFSQLYNTHYLFDSTQEYKKIFNACTVAFTLVVVCTFIVPAVRVSRGWIVIAVIAVIVLVSLSRFLLRRMAHLLRTNGFLTARTLVVGTDGEACAIARQLKSRPGCGTEVVGFIDEAGTSSNMERDVQVLGTVDALPKLVKDLEVDQLIVSTSALSHQGVVQIFQSFGNSDNIDLRFSPGLFEIYTSGVQVKEIGNVHLVSMKKVRLDMIETTVKTIIDYGIGALGLLCLLPFLLIVAFTIKLDSPGPVLYRRRVVGRRGYEFDAFKFRTMYVNGDEILARNPGLKTELAMNQKLKDDPRVTRVGRVLRKYSIDEFPQLINVLMGQMSLVGPRMITPAEVEKYGKWRLNLWTVKPGITGLWQVSGRSDVSYTDRVQLDMYYIRNYTLWTDLMIFLRTIPAVLSRKGAY
jgi:exopolysaccharide biosynthesis polyprenyl glycosylphosphotransferase